MNHGIFRRPGAAFFGGMGACPHVSEAKLNPNGGADAVTFSVAGALAASCCPRSRLEKQTAARQVQA